MNKSNRFYIILKIIKEYCIRISNNSSTKRFFRKNHSIILKPLHTQNVKRCCKIGSFVHIDYNCRVDCYYLNNNKPVLIIKRNTLICFNVTLTCAKHLEIGENCMIASNVFISDLNHGIDLSKGFYPGQELTTKDTIIGNNVWIGEKAIILAGSKIGNNCVIGAGAVISKSIPDNCMVVGNPGKVIKKYDYTQKKWLKVKDI